LNLPKHIHLTVNRLPFLILHFQSYIHFTPNLNPTPPYSHYNGGSVRSITPLRSALDGNSVISTTGEIPTPFPLTFRQPCQGSKPLTRLKHDGDPTTPSGFVPNGMMGSITLPTLRV